VDDLESKKCKDLIRKYRSGHITDKTKESIRNKIYMCLQPSIIKWIPEILSKKGIYLERQEIISRSWDCFIFSLKKYDSTKIYGLPNHFYAYTRFYLLMHPPYRKDDEEAEQTSEDRKITQSIDSEQSIYENLDELKNFRKALPKEYRMVFDDSVMSLTPVLRDRQFRLSESTISGVRYQESKRLFKIFIDYLLRR